MSEQPETYRIRKRYGDWYVEIYRGYTLASEAYIRAYGPYDFAGADSKAKELDMPDGDKGPEQAHVRGHNATR